jgi:hypothetical protein
MYQSGLMGFWVVGACYHGRHVGVQGYRDCRWGVGEVLSPGEVRFGVKGRVGGVGCVDGCGHPANVGRGSLGSTSRLLLLRHH